MPLVGKVIVPVMIVVLVWSDTVYLKIRNENFVLIPRLTLKMHVLSVTRKGSLCVT